MFLLNTVGISTWSCEDGTFITSLVNGLVIIMVNTDLTTLTLSILTTSLITILLANISPNTLMITRTLANLITTHSCYRISLTISKCTIICLNTLWTKSCIILAISIFITLKCYLSNNKMWLTFVLSSWDLIHTDIIALIITLESALASISFRSRTLLTHTNTRFTPII